MRITITAAAVAALSASLVGQNLLDYSAPTSFTSRGNIGGGVGEIHQGFHPDDCWQAIGEANGANGKVVGFRSVFQDQNLSTQDKFKYVVRSGTVAAGPTTGTAGEIFVSGDLTFHPGTGTGAGAFLVTTSLTTPIDVPCDKFFSVGPRLEAAMWTADGQSCHASNNSAAGNNQAPTATDLAWQIIGAATSATHPSQKRTWRIGLLQAPAALQLANFVGSAAKKFGAGGHYPNAGTDGLAARVRAGTAANGQVAAIFLSGGWGTAIPIFSGKFVLDISSLLTAPVAAGVVAGGVYQTDIAPVLPATLTGNFTFQAVLIDLTAMSATLSNGVGCKL